MISIAGKLSDGFTAGSVPVVVATLDGEGGASRAGIGIWLASVERKVVNASTIDGYAFPSSTLTSASCLTVATIISSSACGTSWANVGAATKGIFGTSSLLGNGGRGKGEKEHKKTNGNEGMLDKFMIHCILKIDCVLIG